MTDVKAANFGAPTLDARRQAADVLATLTGTAIGDLGFAFEWHIDESVEGANLQTAKKSTESLARCSARVALWASDDSHNATECKSGKIAGDCCGTQNGGNRGPTVSGE